MNFAKAKIALANTYSENLLKQCYSKSVYYTEAKLIKGHHVHYARVFKFPCVSTYIYVHMGREGQSQNGTAAIKQQTDRTLN